MIALGHFPDPPPAARGNVYLPLIAVAPVDPVADFCRLLAGDRRQQRPHLELCPMLQQAAIWRAYGLANGEPWDHVDSHGVTPNEYARRAGCRLPDDYAERGNNVESLVAGSSDAAAMFNALAGSTKHADHLFGRGWFQKQDRFGVALCEGGEPYRWYWCVMIGQCGQVSGE
jgi:hypothetical protein